MTEPEREALEAVVAKLVAALDARHEFTAGGFSGKAEAMGEALHCSFGAQGQAGAIEVVADIARDGSCTVQVVDGQTRKDPDDVTLDKARGDCAKSVRAAVTEPRAPRGEPR